MQNWLLNDNINKTIPKFVHSTIMKHKPINKQIAEN